ncbi:putative neutral sphingomyelinase isoform X2 [Anabrus simplex]|uniref:putative neutral sphingomyelinase isoform X2 n=1 Tax=Anabrus simplex TaxID=316456 RepID=UPI0035A2B6EC
MAYRKRGIPVISPDRIHRMDAIGDVLALGRFDLVCLQEVWTEKDYFRIKERIISVLPHSHYFYSGVLGSGLCVFSKFPFSDVFFHQWPVNGYVHKVQHGDWFGGKGIGLCRLKINDIAVNLYTAHLHAEYNRDNDEYLAHRVLQAFDTAQFIRMTSSSNDLIFLGGDLNTEPSDLSYRIITQYAQLQDSFVHSTSPVPDNQVGTNESWRNSYAGKVAQRSRSVGKRIDYIMFKAGRSLAVNQIEYRQPLPERVPGCDYSYSDHEAVSVDISVSKASDLSLSSGDSIPSFQENNEELFVVLEEGLVICNQALVKLTKDQYSYWMISTLLFLIALSILSTSAPYDLHKVHKFALAIVSSIMCFTIFMGTLWNRIEVNGILTGKLAMELAYSRVKLSLSDSEGSSSISENIYQRNH